MTNIYNIYIFISPQIINVSMSGLLKIDLIYEKSYFPVAMPRPIKQEWLLQTKRLEEVRLQAAITFPDLHLQSLQNWLMDPLFWRPRYRKKCPENEKL